LNKHFRKKELLKITLENYELLRRLNQKSSSYNVFKWEEEFREKEKLMKSMSEFPNFYDHSVQRNIIHRKRSPGRLPEINGALKSNSALQKCISLSLLVKSMSIQQRIAKKERVCQ